MPFNKLEQQTILENKIENVLATLKNLSSTPIRVSEARTLIDSLKTLYRSFSNMGIYKSVSMKDGRLPRQCIDIKKLPFFNKMIIDIFEIKKEIEYQIDNAISKKDIQIHHKLTLSLYTLLELLNEINTSYLKTMEFLYDRVMIVNARDESRKPLILIVGKNRSDNSYIAELPLEFNKDKCSLVKYITDTLESKRIKNVLVNNSSITSKLNNSVNSTFTNVSNKEIEESFLKTNIFLNQNKMIVPLHILDHIKNVPVSRFKTGVKENGIDYFECLAMYYKHMSI